MNRVPRTNLFAVTRKSQNNEHEMAIEDWSRLRKASPLNQLLPATQRWCEALPMPVRPVELMKTYPRIANRIAHSWHDAPALQQILSDLVIDRRGGRRGFPPRVLAELMQLRSFRDGGHSLLYRR